MFDVVRKPGCQEERHSDWLGGIDIRKMAFLTGATIRIKVRSTEFYPVSYREILKNGMKKRVEKTISTRLSIFSFNKVN